MPAAQFAIGLDFGTESARALIVNIRDGSVAAQATAAFAHGVIGRSLPTGGQALPPDYALQHPQDWLTAAADACKTAMRQATLSADQVIGIGVDFTSCTMLPCRADGTPLCLIDEFQSAPMAWPKLWKHHGAKAEAERINEVARQRNEPWLARYGGTISLEWFFPKILETLNHAPEVYDAADLFIEAGDWFVWQLISGPFPACNPAQIVRSTCQAGYKAQWNAHDGYPSRDFFRAVHSGLGNVIDEKMRGDLRSPGRKSGELSARAAELLGLGAGTPVSAAIIDAHAGVPGAGVAGADAMVMVMGTSSCHMLNSAMEALVPGVAGVVKDGILPGFFGYETGQASVGDAFAWLVETFGLSHDALNREAATLRPGCDGVMAIDWLNGCRTPLMDGNLSGAFIGLTLSTRPAQLYRALMEATAFGVRWICDTLRDAGVPVREFVASGGLPAKSPLLMQIYADVLGAPIRQPVGDQPVALGAAMLGCLAAGEAVTGHAGVAQVIAAMTPRGEARTYLPDPATRDAYEQLYRIYRSLTVGDGNLASVMRELRRIG